MAYYQKEIETASREELNRLQSERLVNTVRRVYERVPLYRQRMDEAGVKPEDIHGIEDLRKLPFTSKQDLRDTYPYGMFAVPMTGRKWCGCTPPAEPPESRSWWGIPKRI